MAYDPIICTGDIYNIGVSMYDLGYWFVDRFYKEAKLKREGLCQNLITWFNAVRMLSVRPRMILIDGDFVTRNPCPKRIDIVCVFRSQKEAEWIKQTSRGSKHVYELYYNAEMEYGCFVHGFQVCGDIGLDMELYWEAIKIFGRKGEKKRARIFKISIDGQERGSQR
jgi:hypothetical protein